jgi:hypothetical protein
MVKTHTPPAKSSAWKLDAKQADGGRRTWWRSKTFQATQV